MNVLLWKDKLIENFKNDRDFTLFIFVGIFAGVAGGINSTIFSNFLNDVYHLSAEQRGLVEFPRELPGMLIVFVLGFLAFLGDIRVAAIAMVTAAIGIFGLGYMSPTFTLMLLWLMIFSLGTHMCMPLTPSIGMNLSKEESYGRRLGLYSAFGLFATIFGYVIVWIGFSWFAMSYKVAFSIGAFFYLCAAFIFTKMKKTTPKIKRKIHFVYRKKYTLFYLLSLVNGGRKQIFLTFAPWVLITNFGLRPQQFAVLGVLIAIISIATRTIVGRAIDKLGERVVLSSEAVILIIICMGYVFAEKFFVTSIAVIIVSSCYVIDASMSVVEMARSTYVKKIIEKKDDITPTLSLGVSLDHVVAMTIPFFGGLLWKFTGAYQSVFVVAAVIAFLNLILSLNIKIDDNTKNEIA